MFSWLYWYLIDWLTAIMAALKTRLVSWYNNAKHDSARPSFDIKEDLWLLGRIYALPEMAAKDVEFRAQTQGSEDDDPPSPSQSPLKRLSGLIREDFESKFWFTYRKEFPAFAGTSRTNDVGWGCMLRSMQMLIAQGLLVHLQGRDWRRNGSDAAQEFEAQLLTLFLDIDDDDSPLSIHRLVAYTARRADLGVGVYHTPTAVAHAMSYHINSATFQQRLRAGLDSKSSLSMVVVVDGLLSKQQLYDYLTDPTKASGLILLIPLKLGVERMDQAFQQRLQLCIQSNLCLGFVGGKAKHALWFLGYNGEDWLGLDPHCCYRALDQGNLSSQWGKIEDTYHTHKPTSVSQAKLDPNLALGFYCANCSDVDVILELIGSRESVGLPFVSVLA
eukprot:m.45581 g.45581  ORF g.45581 m.45581 type:complete len:388 (+) comp13092_c0_seq1:79-1242(+)